MDREWGLNFMGTQAYRIFLVMLAVWVMYEAKVKGIRHGWVALLLGVVPGVATGFAVYLLIRLKQEKAGA